MTDTTLNRLLCIDSGARRDASFSRAMADGVVDCLRRQHPAVQVQTLDRADGQPHIDSDRVPPVEAAA